MKVFGLLCFVMCGVLLAMGGKSEAVQSINIGDQKLRLTVEIGENGLVEQQFLVSGKVLTDIAAMPWTLETDAGTLTPHTAELTQSDTGSASLKGSCPELDWRLDYKIIGFGMITKTLTLIPRKDILLKQVSLWDCRSKSAAAVSSTSMQDIAAFYREGRHGLFVSLDFPYSRIIADGSETSVTYPPYERLKTGCAYTCHSLTIGATTLTGHSSYGFDDGEVDAMDSYIQERFTPRFNRPMFVSACVNNRYTMPRGNIVFYTMKDHPTLSFNHDLLKREIALMPRLGMEYYQLWTGPFDSVPDDPDPKFVKETVKFAKQHGVRIGDYSGTTAVFCPHYNEHGNTLASYPEANLTDSDTCFGYSRFADFYKDMVVKNDKRYGFEIHCLDFLNIRECNNPKHGHPMGRDSIYSQVRGLVGVLEAIGGVSPDMMTWSNSGNWSEFLPKIAWTNHNLYLTDPYIASPWQGLNMTRLLDDARREQMVSLHYSRFIPYRYLTNCQYFFSQNSIVPDIRNYQYGVLSTIAVTPNLCLGEVRPWIDRLTSDQQAQVVTFYKKWTDFLIRNFDLWKKTYQVGENPGMGAVEIYGHAEGSHGFVFLVNPQYWDRTVEVPLDSSLGLTGSGKVEVHELYPVERLRLTDRGPLPTLGSRIAVSVPAQTVIVLEISPAPQQIEKPRLYGVPGTIEIGKDGYLVKTYGPQGYRERCAVLLPDGSNPIASISVRDYPKQPKRLWSETPVELAKSSDNGIAMDITFRRSAAPTELREWSVRQGGLQDGESAGWINGFGGGTDARFPLFAECDTVKLPILDADADKMGLGPLADFCGAYIDNAFSETQETWIDLKTGNTAGGPKGELISTETAPVTRPLPDIARSQAASWWAQSRFHLPFMYTIGAEPSFDEHTFLVLPFVRHTQVGQVKAWINGAPLEVRRYRYPRNPSLSCYFADLVGSGAQGGENTVVVYFDQAK